MSEPQNEPAVILSRDVTEPTTYRGVQIIELDVPADWFVTPPEPAAPPVPVSPPPDKPIADRVLDELREVARRCGALAGEIKSLTAPHGVLEGADTATGKQWIAGAFQAIADTDPAIYPEVVDGGPAQLGSLVDNLLTALAYYLAGLQEIRDRRGVPAGSAEQDLVARMGVLRNLREELAGRAPVSEPPVAGPPGTVPQSLTYTGDVPLLGDGAPTGRAVPSKLPESQIISGYRIGMATGWFDPRIFPGIQVGRDGASLAAVQQALAKLDVATVVTLMRAGHRLVLHRDTGGTLTYTFIPEPVRRSASLLLVEYYRLSSFPTRYGVGRTVKTFSLLPGERTKIRVSTYKRTSRTRNETASILDSANQETESDFERSMQAEQSTQDASSRGLEYHAEARVEGKASWGWGSASGSVSGGVKGSTNASREEFAKNVTNAVGKNAARASSRRDVQIDTSLEEKSEEGEEQALERELENINLSRTLNFVFRQMNQEYATVLHLVDVRAAFFNGYAESRTEVPLPELDRLLDTYIVEEHRDQVRTYITEELRSIRDHTGAEQPDFVETVTLPGDDGRSYLRVNPALVSAYWPVNDLPPIEVPGLIISTDLHVMRTDGVVVDTFLGRGDGLDAYSSGLQEQAVRARQIENDRAEAELDRLRLALELVRDGNDAGVEMYRTLFPVAQIVNQIDQAAINSPANGQASPTVDAMAP